MSPIAPLAFALFLQGAPGRPYAEERQLLDRHLAQLARAMPDAPTPDDDAALLKQIAAEAGLRNIEIGTPTITETGTLGQSRRTLTATATYPDTDRFFRALQGSARLVDVESLILRAADFGVRIEARLRFHHRAARAVARASLDANRGRDRTRGASREEAMRFTLDEQRALEKSVVLDDLRRRQTSPRLFLAETGSAFRDTAAALTFGSLDGDTGRFSLRGVVAGMGAADGLERRLEGGFFLLREFSRAQKEGCFQFEVVGDSFRAGPEAALALPVDEPFRPTEALCRQDRDSTSIGAGGLPLRASGAASGGLSLRAIDTDLADVAAMIEALTREPFVVAEDVRGRVNVDFSSTSVDEAIRALPVRLDQVGAVRLLRPAGGPSAPVPDEETNAPTGRTSIRAKRGPGEEILAAIAEAEPSYVALGPRGLATLSVFAREVEVADLRRAVITALQLDETREDNARVLMLRERPAEVGPIAASAIGRTTFRPRDLAVDEMALAGIGRSGEETVAFVYSPLGDIVGLRLGDALADGVIAALEANNVLIDTAEGPVRISLTTPRLK